MAEFFYKENIGNLFYSIAKFFLTLFGFNMDFWYKVDWIIILFITYILWNIMIAVPLFTRYFFKRIYLMYLLVVCIVLIFLILTLYKPIYGTYIIFSGMCTFALTDASGSHDGDYGPYDTDKSESEEDFW